MNSDQQNNNRGKGGGNKRNVTAVVSILLWALVLTVLVNYATSLFRQANSVELSYGVFRELIRQDCVDGVLMDSHKYTIYLKDGVSVDAEGNITKTAAAAGITDGSESGDTLETVPPPSEWNASGNQQMAPPPSEWDEEKTTYYCAPLTSDIPELIKLFDEHNVVKFGPEYVEELNPIISLLISWVLPMVVMVLLFSFLFRNMAG